MKLLSLVLVGHTDKRRALIEFTPSANGYQHLLGLGVLLAAETEQALREMVATANKARTEA